MDVAVGSGVLVGNGVLVGASVRDAVGSAGMAAGLQPAIIITSDIADTFANLKNAAM